MRYEQSDFINDYEQILFVNRLLHKILGWNKKFIERRESGQLRLCRSATTKHSLLRAPRRDAPCCLPTRPRRVFRALIGTQAPFVIL